MGEMKNSYSILVGKPEEKRPLGRPGCRVTINFSKRTLLHGIN
jgi:hypothetical protein